MIRPIPCGLPSAHVGERAGVVLRSEAGALSACLSGLPCADIGEDACLAAERCASRVPGGRAAAPVQTRRAVRLLRVQRLRRRRLIRCSTDLLSGGQSAGSAVVREAAASVPSVRTMSVKPA